MQGGSDNPINLPWSLYRLCALHCSSVSQSCPVIRRQINSVTLLRLTSIYPPGGALERNGGGFVDSERKKTNLLKKYNICVLCRAGTGTRPGSKAWAWLSLARELLSRLDRARDRVVNTRLEECQGLEKLEPYNLTTQARARSNLPETVRYLKISSSFQPKFFGNL